MLVNEGTYSINAHSSIEATVDFLPLILTAALSLLRIDLPSAFMISSLMGLYLNFFPLGPPNWSA